MIPIPFRPTAAGLATIATFWPRLAFARGRFTLIHPLTASEKVGTAIAIICTMALLVYFVEKR